MSNKPMEFGKPGKDQNYEDPLRVDRLIKEMRKRNNLHSSRIK